MPPPQRGLNLPGTHPPTARRRKENKLHSFTTAMDLPAPSHHEWIMEQWCDDVDSAVAGVVLMQRAQAGRLRATD